MHECKKPEGGTQNEVHGALHHMGVPVPNVNELTRKVSASSTSYYRTYMKQAKRRKLYVPS